MEDDSLVIQIGDVYVSEDVLNVYFSCDLEKCKGVCCATENASVGAPITDQESDWLKEHKETLVSLVPESNQFGIAQNGVYERQDVRLFTSTMPDTAQCVFAKQDKSCWTCAIQQNEEQLGFSKPVSCSLFPIREMMTDDFKPLLVLEFWDECDPAYDKGEKDDILVYEALKGGLIQRFGLSFYEALDDFVKSGKLAELINEAE